MEPSANQFTESMKKRHRFDFDAFDKLCAKLLDEAIILRPTGLDSLDEINNTDAQDYNP